LQCHLSLREATGGNWPKETAAERILGETGKATSEESLRQIISDACAHLIAIDQAVRARRAEDKAENDPALDAALLSVVNPLLDLLVLEGVYPSISPNVGFRNRLKKQSLLYNKDSGEFPNLNMLQTVLVNTLNAIAFDEDSGFSSQVRSRILTDLIIGNFDLAFSPARDKPSQIASKLRLDHILDG
jgi:hypothetical protein